MQRFLYGEQIDKRLNWPLGRAERLARQGQIPHVILPDGAIRFEWQAIEKLLCRPKGTSHEPQKRAAP